MEPGEEKRPLLPHGELSASPFLPEAAFVAVEGLPGEPSSPGRQAFHVEVSMATNDTFQDLRPEN